MNWAAKIAGKAESIFGNIRNNILRRTDAQFREVQKWYEEDPYHLKKSDFPYLGTGSLVFDLGGYTGDWTSDIFSRYCCTIYVFEPVSFYAKLIAHRFKDNPKIKIFDTGLADKTQEVDIHVDRFSSSIVNKKLDSKPTEKIKLLAFGSFLEQYQVSHIDLVKINIEGAEYDLLAEVIRSGKISIIKGLLVQFHDFVADAANKRAALQTQLSQTHRKVFEFPFVWEYWERKT